MIPISDSTESNHNNFLKTKLASKNIYVWARKTFWKEEAFHLPALFLIKPHPKLHGLLHASTKFSTYRSSSVRAVKLGSVSFLSSSLSMDAEEVESLKDTGRSALY